MTLQLSAAVKSVCRLHFNYMVPAAGSTPDKYYMDNLRAFVIHVPEPSAIALGLFCVARVMSGRLELLPGFQLLPGFVWQRNFAQGN
ncbi:MAG TPA: hypothetical protein VNU68_32085 [Verrucomicrobiae bacterium]|nr:hypothetical protein [Verrucomicrobiae bacterium]